MRPTTAEQCRHSVSISNPPNYGSPDWQRGYYSAQKKLASVPANTIQTSVIVPPNAESIIVTCQNAGVGNELVCLGLTSAQYYASAKSTKISGSAASVTWFFDTSAVIDSTVELTWNTAPTFAWTVYADAATHLTADISKATDENGQMYVVSSAPSVLSGDHPANELLFAQFGNAPSGSTVIAAPGAGNRLRLFYATASALTAGQFINLSGSVSGKIVLAGIATNPLIPTTIDYKPTGVILGTNDALIMTTAGGTGTCNVVYTVETV